ncbi:MAG TPA: hypothetical protein VFZ57_07800 [Thermoanaerobaculia bacterium]|nr:hypothetical protein [Thermoanaerobaculia bacterium]
MATAAFDVLKALRSKAASAAEELRKTVEDDKPAPPGVILEVHGALLGGLMDKRVKSAATERKRLFGIPLETEVPARTQMRALVKRFELAFLRTAPSSATNPSQP